jgi:hypothetical protein
MSCPVQTAVHSASTHRHFCYFDSSLQKCLTKFQTFQLCLHTPSVFSRIPLRVRAPPVQKHWAEVSVRKPESDYLGDLGVDGRVILKQILNIVRVFGLESRGLGYPFTGFMNRVMNLTVL